VSAAEELADLIRGIDGPSTLGGLEVAKAILADGYRKQRTIATVQELLDLPEGSVIVGGGIVPRIKAEGDLWIGDGIDVDSEHIIKWVKNATVIHEPS